VSVRRGERVESGRPLVQVVAPDTLDLIVPIPAAALTQLHIGQTAAVRQSGDSVAAPGRVAAIAPGVDSVTNAGRAVIRVPNPGGRLYPGASATARVRLGVVHDALVVPDSAITLAGDRRAVARHRARLHSPRRHRDAGGRRPRPRCGRSAPASGSRPLAYGLEDG
jgi:multidrug efflux pump subunit AcrA (membrane-fusion protein)